MTKQVRIVETAKQELQAILTKLEVMPVDKAARVLNKSFSADAKFARFLNQKFESGMGLLTDRSRREKMLEAVEEHGMTSLNEKKALVLQIVSANADAEVEKKRLEVTRKGTLQLSDEQKAKLEAKLTDYRKFVTTTLLRGAVEIGMYVGVLEDAPAAVEAPAPVQEPVLAK